MIRSTTTLTLLALAFSAVAACPSRQLQAEVRRGILYEILHFGRGCDPSWGFSPCQGVHGWIDMELEAEYARIREEVRIHHMQLYLHNQDHKKLLHPECSPFQDCYWGIYPTCWRPFPGRRQCPMPVPEPVLYEDGPPFGHQPPESVPPGGPKLFDPMPDEHETGPAWDEWAPLAPETPQPEPNAPLYFE